MARGRSGRHTGCRRVSVVHPRIRDSVTFPVVESTCVGYDVDDVVYFDLEGVDFVTDLLLAGLQVVQLAVQGGQLRQDAVPQDGDLRRHAGDVSVNRVLSGDNHGFRIVEVSRYRSDIAVYYGFQTVCKCPFWALLVTLVTDSNQTWAN